MEKVYNEVEDIQERRKHIFYLGGVLRKVYGKNIEQLLKDAKKCVLLRGDLSKEKASDVMKIVLPLMLAEAEPFEELQELVNQLLPD